MNPLPIDLSIIVASYNTRELLHEYIESVYRHTQGITFELICVDDDSPDGSADMAAVSLPQVRCCETESSTAGGDRSATWIPLTSLL